MGGLENPDAVALLHGTLAGYSRRGSSVPTDLFLAWAADEGWPTDAVLALRGVALAAENATPSLGQLTISRAGEGELLVRLTRDEARLAHAALREVLLGPYRIPDDEFHTLTGFRRDEADVLLDALGASLTDPSASD
jgi:hypothetical protein